MSARSSTWTTALAAVLIIAFLVGLGSANARFTLTAQDANEFLPRWEGAHAWLTSGISPYDPRVSAAAQRRVYGREAAPEQGEDPLLFLLPFPSMLLYAPWGLLDYSAARAGWMTLLEVLLVAAALLAVRLAAWRPPPLLLALLVAVCVAWPPGIRSIVAGNLAIVSLSLVLGALLCIGHSRDAVAGILLALALADPVLGLVVLIASLSWAASRKRWAIIAGALGTGALLIAVSLVVMPGWPLEWLRQVVATVEAQRTFGMQWGLLAQGFGSPAWILALALALGEAWVVWSCLGKGERWLTWSVVTALTLVAWLTSLLLESTSTIYLLPAVVLILGGIGQRLRRAGHWVVAAALLVVGPGLWAAYILFPPEPGGSLLTVSAGPAAVCAGLLWVRWWVTRGVEVSRLEFEGLPGG